MNKSKAGVYIIENRTTAKKYIGSSSNIFKRLNSHWEKLAKGNHPNPHLQAAWNLYGERDFDFETFKVTDTAEEARELEQWMLEAHYDTWHELYNIAKHVESPAMTEEVRYKISEANKTRPTSEETRKKISEAMKGRKNRQDLRHSEETRKKISEANKGKKYREGSRHSEESRKKISEAAKLREALKREALQNNQNI